MNEKIGDRLLVVVVGGGFGGLNVVQGLRDVPVRILLVDKRNHHLFQPLLYPCQQTISPRRYARYCGSRKTWRWVSLNCQGLT